MIRLATDGEWNERQIAQAAHADIHHGSSGRESAGRVHSGVDHAGAARERMYADEQLGGISLHAIGNGHRSRVQDQISHVWSPSSRVDENLALTDSPSVSTVSIVWSADVAVVNQNSVRARQVHQREPNV